MTHWNDNPVWHVSGPEWIWSTWYHRFKYLQTDDQQGWKPNWKPWSQLGWTNEKFLSIYFLLLRKHAPWNPTPINVDKGDWPLHKTDCKMSARFDALKNTSPFSLNNDKVIRKPQIERYLFVHIHRPSGAPQDILPVDGKLWVAAALPAISSRAGGRVVSFPRRSLRETLLLDDGKRLVAAPAYITATPAGWLTREEALKLPIIREGEQLPEQPKGFVAKHKETLFAMPKDMRPFRTIIEDWPDLEPDISPEAAFLGYYGQAMGDAYRYMRRKPVARYKHLLDVFDEKVQEGLQGVRDVFGLSLEKEEVCERP